MQENFQNGLGSYFTNSGNQGDVKTGDEGLSLTVNKRFDNPSIHSDFYLMFGYVEVELKAGEGKGIVSSFFCKVTTWMKLILNYLVVMNMNGNQTISFKEIHLLMIVVDITPSTQAH